MLKAITLQNKTFDIKLDADEIQVNESLFEWDFIKLNDRHFHILRNHKSYRVEFVKFEKGTKTFYFQINGSKHEIKVKDRYDLLLERLGMSDLAVNKINTIKAPMPGLILDVKVSEGDQVKKGEPLMILEAMKMENILKSPVDGTVKHVKVKEGQGVEKNQVLIEF